MAHKSFSLEPNLLTAHIRTCLRLGSAGSIQQIKQAAALLVKEKLKIIRNPLVQWGTSAFKSQVMKYFAPRSRKGQALAMLLQEYFNDDWRGVRVSRSCVLGAQVLPV